MFGQVSVTSLILAALGSEGAFQMWGAFVSFQVSAVLFILNILWMVSSVRVCPAVGGHGKGRMQAERQPRVLPSGDLVMLSSWTDQLSRSRRGIFILFLSINVFGTGKKLTGS